MNHFTTTTLALALLVPAATPALAEGDSSRGTPQVESTDTRYGESLQVRCAAVNLKHQGNGNFVAGMAG